MYQNLRISKKYKAPDAVPIMAITRGRLQSDPFACQFATGSFNGAVVLWELTRLAGGENKLVQLKVLPLGFGKTLKQQLADPHCHIQSLVFRRQGS